MEVGGVGSRRKPSSSVMEWMPKLWSGLLRVKPECRERWMTKMDKDSRGERSALMGKVKWNKKNNAKWAKNWNAGGPSTHGGKSS